MPFTMMPPATTVPAAARGGGLVVDFDLRWWITTDFE